MHPKIVLAAFDRRQVKGIAAGKAPCLFHTALAASVSEP
jgi:hypothetical protein